MGESAVIEAKLESGAAHVHSGTVRHVYVHIPFCARICPYCAFYKTRADPSQTQRFCEALLRELRDLRERFTIEAETIFFGGGTPSALTSDQLDFVLRGFAEQLGRRSAILADSASRLPACGFSGQAGSLLAESGWKPDLLGREWTIEANPGSVSARKAKLLRERGITRVSLGVQSWDDHLLGLLGREHNAQQAEESFRIFRAAGHDNISIDLMFGLPGQTLAQWEATLERSVALEPEHISAYCLTYEEDTEFFRRQQRGEYREDNASDARFFESALRILEAAGYRQYEISNYARPGFESVHNRGYWRGEDYLGIGPSAFSTLALERWQNIADYRAYSDRVLGNESPIASTEALSPQMKRGEQIALLLRTREGVPGEWLDLWPNECKEFAELGLLERHGDRFVLTPKGKLLADSVAAAFV